MPAKKRAKATPRKAAPPARRAARKPAKARPQAKRSAVPSGRGSIFDIVPHKDDDSEPRYAPEREEFLEPEEHAETPDELELKMRVGQKAYDVYSQEGRDELSEDDEVEDWEAGFTLGATGKARGAACASCKKPLSELRDRRAIIEREFAHGVFFFCSEKCAEKFGRRFAGK
jgi:hypothetical protein